MNIGLFLGSFNPIHNGHLGLAQYILTQPEVDEVWFVVSPNNPLKDKSTLLDEKLRLSLTELAVADIAGLRACDIELTLPKPSYTVNTLRALSELYPQHRFTLIIGSDNMAIFDRWKDYRYILDNYPIVVYPRQGDDISKLSGKYPEMKVLAGAPMFNISSTRIRLLYKNGESYRQLVPKTVYSALSRTKNLWE